MMKPTESENPPSPVQCPTPKQLSEFVEGGLTIVEHERVELHLDGCDACHDTVLKVDTETETRLGKLIATKPDGTETRCMDSQHDETLDLLVRNAKQDWRDQGMAPKTNLRIGGTIGNYVLKRSLGEGNMGKVVLASHQQMKREVALKFIAPELLVSAAARTRFQREIEATAKLQHPNLVTAHDAGEVDGQHFLVMEYVQGIDLRSRVKQSGPLDVAAALKYTAGAARGLHHAHEKGVVHRDVKPGNIMLGADQTAKVTDLGLARFADAGSDSVEISETGLVIGTSAFMSPEQCAGTREIDYRSDIYSLGCTLFYLLTGRNVFPADSTLQMLRAHAEEPIPSLREIRPDCPPGLEELLNRMLAKRPQDRPESMAIVAQELDDLLTRTDFQPTKVSSSRGAGRLPGWPLVAGVLTVLLAIFLAAQLMPHTEDSPGTGVTRDLPAEIEMLKIPAGTFVMGAPAEDPFASSDEKPDHEVQLTHDFMLGKFEVTSAEFHAVMGSEAASSGLPEVQTDPSSGAVPISGITWLEAIRFCNQLSILQGFRPYYEIHEDNSTVSIQRGSDGYRLPTEAEWEYACRAGSQTPWYFGESADHIDEFAWFSDNTSGETQAVGLKKPNAFGLHDMLGNVPEWCWDRFDEDYYRNSERVNPPGSTKGEQRVFRGGGVRNLPAQLRSSTRNPLGMDYGFSNGVGLRIARNLPSNR